MFPVVGTTRQGSVGRTVFLIRKVCLNRDEADEADKKKGNCEIREIGKERDSFEFGLVI